MHYIIMDLEWNQPLSYASSAYKQVGGKLIFELIQIGAVKVDERIEICDTFTQLIQPAQYVKLHPRIRRITGITQDDLAGAPGFNEALDSFLDWCGEDCAILTWGCDDISVLEQNIQFFESPRRPGAIYDMQKLFGELSGGGKDRKGLKAAMDYYQIEPKEDMAFHNALNDAYYTAQVFARFPDPRKVLEYPQTARKLIHTEPKKRERKTAMSVPSVREGLKTRAALRPNCPVCGRRLELDRGYLKQKENQYAALSVCPDHGLMFVKVTFLRDEEGKLKMERVVSPSDEKSKAYAHTKLLQWERKLESQGEIEC